MEEELYARDETDMQRELDDLHCSSDFRNACSYDCLQEDIVDIFSSIQKLVDLPAFDCHIRQDLHKMGDIKKNHLEWRKQHLMKTDCAIVVAGETSSGKSSIINLIIGKDIVPTDIMATTTRVCRIRYSEKIRVSTLDKEGKELVKAEFNDEEKLIEMMEDLAMTNDHQIEYIDVLFPVSILKGNIIIVDMPGRGDREQDYVANKMMEYLPKAVAIIFVVNVACADRLQDDRLLQIIKRARESMNLMYCFDPEDAIFLLNKWDAVPQKRKRKKDLYEELKDKVHEIWNGVKDTNILKFSAAKAHEEEAYKVEFDKFYKILKEVITKNEIKRVNVHLRFIKSFIDECDVSLSNKLRCARESKEETIKEFDQLNRDLQVIKNKRQEAYSTFQESVIRLLEDTTEGLYQYMHSTGFRSIILKGIEKYTHLTIGRELDMRIEKATHSWQQENIGTFERKIMQNLKDNLVKIHQSLHSIKNKIRGFDSPLDVEDKLDSILLSLSSADGNTVAENMAMMSMPWSSGTAQAVSPAGVVSGLVFTGLVAFNVLDDLETVAKNAFKARINKITKQTINQFLHRTYAERLENVAKSNCEGDLKREIDDVSEILKLTRSRIDLYKKNELSLLSLSSEISKLQNRSEKFGNIEITLD